LYSYKIFTSDSKPNAKTGIDDDLKKMYHCDPFGKFADILQTVPNSATKISLKSILILSKKGFLKVAGLNFCPT
jgi:hypothetical protein